MKEDRVEEVQVPRPEIAHNEVNTYTPGPHEDETILGSGVKSQADLQQLAQQASNATNLLNGAPNHDPDGTSVDFAPNPSVGTHAQEIQGHLNGDLGNSMLRGAPTGVVAPLNGDNPVGGGNPGDLGPFPDLGGNDLINDTSLPWEGDPHSEGSFAASQQLTAPSIAASEEEQHQIQAFAKLEFDDGEFYMTTYAVELGRDIHAARQAFERDFEAHENTDSKSRKRSAGHTASSIRARELGRKHCQ